MHLTLKKIGIVGALFVAVFLSMATVVSAAVDWKGITWEETFGSSTVNLSDQLEVATSANCPSCLGGVRYNTPQPFRDSPTPWVKASFIDNGPGTPGGRIWIEDETFGALTTFGAVPTSPYYRIFLWNYGASGSQMTLDTTVLRTAGTHELQIGKRSNGSIDFWIDGVLVLNTTEITPDYFGDVYLTGNGSADTDKVIFTDYSTGTDYNPPDADGDGVLDGSDLCPGTADSAIVDADGCAESQLSTIEVRLDLVRGDHGRFNLQVDGTTYEYLAGDDDSTGEVVVTPGEHTVSETGTRFTRITSYRSTIVCRDDGGYGSVVAYGEDTSLDLDVGQGEDIVCVITNTAYRDSGRGHRGR